MHTDSTARLGVLGNRLAQPVAKLEARKSRSAFSWHPHARFIRWIGQRAVVAFQRVAISVLRRDRRVHVVIADDCVPVDDCNRVVIVFSA